MPSDRSARRTDRRLAGTADPRRVLMLGSDRGTGTSSLGWRRRVGFASARSWRMSAGVDLVNLIEIPRRCVGRQIPRFRSNGERVQTTRLIALSWTDVGSILTKMSSRDQASHSRLIRPAYQAVSSC